MGENFSGATEISDAVWKIEVSKWNSSVYSDKFVTEYTTEEEENKDNKEKEDEEEDNNNDDNKKEDNDNINFLDLLTKFFGFVNKIFWICRRNFLDLLTKFFGFVDEIFWICRRNFLDFLRIFSVGHTA